MLPPDEPERLKKTSRGRLDIIREKAGRGGKTLTVVTNFVGIGLPEKEQLAKKMQKACGTGGTVKEDASRFREITPESAFSLRANRLFCLSLGRHTSQFTPFARASQLGVSPR